MLRAPLHETEIRRAMGLPEEGSRTVQGLAPLGAAEDRCLYFVNKKLTEPIRQSLSTLRDCIVIVPTGSLRARELQDCAVLEAKDPREAIMKVLHFIQTTRRYEPWVKQPRIEDGVIISPHAVVDEHVEIGAGTVIEPFCVVEGDVRIGRGSILKAGARVCSRVTIGDNSFVGFNSVIGHQGFGFVRDDDGNKRRIPHLGGVVIGSFVEIGSLTTVPSGTILPTRVDDYAKVDDHVHVGHNVHVAKGASVTAAVIIGGTSVIEEEAWVGMNCSIRDGRRVGRRSLIGMDVSVQEDIADGYVARAPRPEVRARTDDDGLTIGFQ